MSSRSPAEWWVSHYDQRAHAFRTRGEVYSEAVCTHTALTSNLTEDAARLCHACSQIIGGELAEQYAERDRWGL